MNSIKIRSLRVRGFKSLGDTSFQFHPRVTIIRGENGAGKSSVLDLLSFIGHIDIIPRKPLRDESAWTFCIAAVISPAGGGAPKEFNLYFGPTRRASHSAVDRVSGALAGSRLRSHGERPESLKTLAHDWNVYWRSDHDRLCLLELVKMIEWSRTRSDPESNRQKALSDAFSNLSDPTISSLAGYLDHPYCLFFNSDTYEYGTGLDIKETIKRLTEDQLSAMLGRLGALGPSGDVHNSEGVQLSWNAVFLNDALTRIGRERISINGNDLETISSGENEAIFLLIVIHSLVASGSILLLDEPEIHFGQGAVVRLYDELIEIADAWNTQFVMVTHMPILYTDRIIRDIESPSSSPSASVKDWLAAPDGSVRTLYVDRGDDGSSIVRSGYSALEAALSQLDDLHSRLRAQMRVDNVVPKPISIRQTLWRFIKPDASLDPPGGCE